MNTNTGAIREFDSNQTIPSNYIPITEPVKDILSKFTRRERKHLWATYQILNLTNKMTFDNFVKTLVQAYNPENL